ncbi:hypothetical protein ACM55M_08190 [Flavobacterium sp. ZT3R25]|uniref:hypothetical protein n=1 Tax=Flavobacterium galactosi TaxID=3398735 RepID=UPI003A871E40
MNRNFTSTTEGEKILEENPLFIISESKVVFKNEKLSFYLNQISSVRLVKNRDFNTNIMLLVFLILSYKLISSPMNSIFYFLKLFFITISLIVVCRIKKDSYKIIINIGKYGFKEILISKKNLSFAIIFISKFMIDSKENPIKLETEFNC